MVIFNNCHENFLSIYLIIESQNTGWASSNIPLIGSLNLENMMLKVRV